MKLATRNNNTRDGELLVVSQDNTNAVVVGPVAPPTNRSWMIGHPRKSNRAIYQALNRGERTDAFAVDVATLHSPLPRAYGWIDGSAYINHIVLVRKARGAKPTKRETDPLRSIRAAATHCRPQQTYRCTIRLGM